MCHGWRLAPFGALPAVRRQSGEWPEQMVPVFDKRKAIVGVIMWYGGIRGGCGLLDGRERGQYPHDGAMLQWNFALEYQGLHVGGLGELDELLALRVPGEPHGNQVADLEAVAVVAPPVEQVARVGALHGQSARTQVHGHAGAAR